MRLSRLQISILKNLFNASKGLAAHTLISRNREPLSNQFSSLFELENNGLISCKNIQYSLTEKGRDFILTQEPQEQLISDSKMKYREKISTYRIGINEFYIPKIEVIKRRK